MKLIFISNVIYNARSILYDHEKIVILFNI